MNPGEYADSLGCGCPCWVRRCFLWGVYGVHVICCIDFRVNHHDIGMTIGSKEGVMRLWLLMPALCLLVFPFSPAAHTWHITPDGTGDAPTI